MFKVLLAFFLAGLAAYFWLGRYELLYTDHGELMTGVDYVQQHIGLPLQTAKTVAALLAAALVLAGRRKLALACAIGAGGGCGYSSGDQRAAGPSE